MFCKQLNGKCRIKYAVLLLVGTLCFAQLSLAAEVKPADNIASLGIEPAVSFTTAKKATWAEMMVATKKSILSQEGDKKREYFVSAVFSIKKEFPREHNFFFHYYPEAYSWFTQDGNDELVQKIIPEVLKKLPADSALHNDLTQAKSEREALNLFLKAAKARSPIKELTPETKTRTPEDADKMLVEDWLYQADGLPVAEDCRNELNWTRKIIERIKKANPRIDFKKELAELAKLEPVLQKTIKDNPDVPTKPGLDMPELIAASIHGSLDVDIAVPNGTYTLQLLVHEGWRPGRSSDIIIEGKTVGEKYHFWDKQGKTFDHASVLRYTFTLTDSNIDIKFKDYTEGTHLGGLILAKGQGKPGVSEGIVKSKADLDFKDVIKAINFGDTKTLTIGGVEFVAAAVNTTVNGVTNKAVGDVFAGQYSQHIPKKMRQDSREDAIQASPFIDTYLAIRRIKRKAIFKDPVIDFDDVMLVDTPFPMKWVGDSPYKRRYRNSPFTYFVEWNHQSQHRSGFHALSGGRLMVLKGLHPGGDVRTLSPTKAQADGAILRPDISFDGKKVLFSYKAESEMNYHIYEMNVDGAGLKQLTFGNYDDNDPIYLPDGHIMFVTTRGNTYIRCTHYSPSTVLARCDGDGKNIYLVSQNNEPDWIPSLLDDGRVVYTRWEYSDKNVMRVNGLWTTNIDGTGTEVLWGNQSVWPDNLSYPRQIPGTKKVMFAGVGHHCWFNGSIGIVDPAKGREYPNGLIKVTPDVQFEESGDGPTPVAAASTDYHAAGKFVSYKTACPLSENLFLVSAARGVPTKNGKNSGFRFAHNFALYLMDIDGNKELIYCGVNQVLYAMPLKSRKMPHQKASIVQWPGTGKDRKPVKPGTFYSNNVYEGSGIPKGKAKYVRIIEMDYQTYSTWLSGYYLKGPIPTPQVSATSLDSVKIVLGTAPVEDDGSYFFTAPAGKQLFFELLDKDYRCMQVMRSFVGVMPGENRGCVGCHERQTNAPTTASNKRGKALRRAPSTITPPPWGVTAISYKKMIQPIFEKNCVTCHMGDGKARKKLDLTLRPSSDYMGQFSDPYLTLLGSSSYASSAWFTAHLRGGRKPTKNYAGGFDVSRGAKAWMNDGPMRTFKPMTFFSYNSLLLNTLKDGKHNKVKLSPDELRLLTTWIDCNTPYRDGEELRQTPDPIFSGIEMIPVRPEMQNAPVIMRP